MLMENVLPHIYFWGIFNERGEIFWPVEKLSTIEIRVCFHGVTATFSLFPFPSFYPFIYLFYFSLAATCWPEPLWNLSWFERFLLARSSIVSELGFIVSFVWVRAIYCFLHQSCEPFIQLSAHPLRPWENRPLSGGGHFVSGVLKGFVYARLASFSLRGYPCIDKPF